MKYLLDTCFISELVRPKPNVQVLDWLSSADEETIFISVLTLGELEKGIARIGKTPRSTKLLTWVRRDLTRRFSGRIVAVNEAIATRWGTMMGTSERSGKTLPVIDSLLAATCLELGMTVVTRNGIDLERCGAISVNPWASGK